MLKWVGVLVLTAGLCFAYVSFRKPDHAAITVDEILNRRNVAAKGGESSNAQLAAARIAERVPIVPPVRTPPAAPMVWRQEVVVQRVADVPAAQGETVVAPQRDRLATAGPEELARALQGELRRVGCYDGAIDGSWGPASKRGMAAFTDRVNATLPGTGPDYILLKLVQGQRGQVCGKGCGAGELQADNGRCVAAASAARKAGSSPVAKTRTTDPAQPSRAAPVPLPAGTPAPDGGKSPNTADEQQVADEPGNLSSGRMTVGAPVGPQIEPNAPRSGNADDQQIRAVRSGPRHADGGVGSRNYGPVSRYSQPRPKRWTQTIFDTISTSR